MTRLYYFWSESNASRVRLALDYKKVSYEALPLAYDDDATFFDLGVARAVPILQLDDGVLLTDSVLILQNLDTYFPNQPIMQGVADVAGWQALLKWRESVDGIMQRLLAPALPGYADISRDAETLASYKSSVMQRFAMSVEELSNDRYAAFAQLDKLTNLKALGAHLCARRFYFGQPSVADMLLAADFFPLQILDGVTLPIDLMYYIQRVEDVCHTSLREGLLAA